MLIFHVFIFLFVGVLMWDFNKLLTVWDSEGTFVICRIFIVLPLFTCGFVKIKVKFFK
jgi:hypothetical protein